MRAGDLLVFNDTRVIKARVFARKATGGKVEMLVERVMADDEAWVQLRASHPPAIGSLAALARRCEAPRVLARDERFFRLRFAGTGPLVEWLDRHGDVPLPPYIARRPGDDDTARYQTVYAREPGAVAAPTAGLHFDEAMLAALAARGVAHAFVTLHVGAGTFQPVQDEDLALHRMHSEWYRIPPATAAAIAATRARGGRVIAVGTTSLRALESAAHRRRRARRAGETTLFVTPGFRFRVVDRLLTNFHLPKSTLLMLVSARSEATTRSARPTPMPSPPSTVFSATAMRCCSSGRPGRPTSDAKARHLPSTSVAGWRQSRPSLFLVQQNRWAEGGARPVCAWQHPGNALLWRN